MEGIWTPPFNGRNIKDLRPSFNTAIQDFLHVKACLHGITDVFTINGTQVFKGPVSKKVSKGHAGYE